MPSSDTYGSTRQSASTKTSPAADDQSVTQQKTGQELSSTMATLTPQSITFPELADEIRNHIYSYIAEDDSEIYIDGLNPGKLKSASAMAGLNKQVREEYISMLDTNSPNIHAVVRDFDFSHVITFYDLLQQSTLEEHFKQASARRTKHLVIHLTFTPEYPPDTSELSSSAWFDFNKHPEWRGSPNGTGTHVQVHYRVKSESENWLEELLGMVHEVR